MKELILIKNGEIALKGLNRTTFEDVLLKNIRRKLADLGKFRCYKAQSTMYIEPQEDGIDLDEAVDRVRKVFGIAALTRACIVEKDFEDIKAKTVEYLKETLSEASTFKVEAKRSDKTFPMNTPQICTELGGYLLEQFPGLTVDVHNPQVTVMVEIRDFAAYIHAGQIEGAGGMPVSTSGRAMLLVSGGIDSPVAGYMMAKRGMEVLAVHFVSPPYTSERAKLKVITLCEKMSAYCGRMQLFIVPFTKMQEAIRDNCPEELFTVIMRRMMMKIAEKLAQRSDCAASSPARAWPRWPARRSRPSPAPTWPARCRCCGLSSAWTKRRSSASPGRSTPLRPPSCPMRTAAPSSPPSTPAPGPNWPWWRRRKPPLTSPPCWRKRWKGPSAFGLIPNRGNVSEGATHIQRRIHP